MVRFFFTTQSTLPSSKLKQIFQSVNFTLERPLGRQKEKELIPQAEKDGTRVNSGEKGNDNMLILGMFLFLRLSVGTCACLTSVDLIGFSLLIHCLDKIPLFFIFLKVSIIATRSF